MIVVIYGTTGELIKIAPLLVALDADNTPYLTWCTGQQSDQIPGFLAQFKLRSPDRWLGRGRRGADLRKNTDIPIWASRVLVTALFRRRALRASLVSDGGPALVIVHGDTLTTILGATIGRLLRTPVAHVEAGYRSGTWRAPFPEEMVRRAVSRIARIHYASGPHTAENLRLERTRGEIVDTGFNTIRDSMELASKSGAEPEVQTPATPFGVVSLHRYELLNRPDLLKKTLQLLSEASRVHNPLLFVDHSVTTRAVSAAGLDNLFHERFQRIPRQPYFGFISLVQRSSFVITDSGGSQQECWQLGHPCLVHRSLTEHTDSVGGSVVISEMNFDIVQEFLSGGWHRYIDQPTERQSPTAVIIEHLKNKGFVRSECNTPLSADRRESMQ